LLLESCFEQIVVEYNSKKVLPDHQQRAKLIADFRYVVRSFLLFSFSASGKISVAKPQRVLLANR
jgi:hypothetical protein